MLSPMRMSDAQRTRSQHVVLRRWTAGDTQSDRSEPSREGPAMRGVGQRVSRCHMVSRMACVACGHRSPQDAVGTRGLPYVIRAGWCRVA